MRFRSRIKFNFIENDNMKKTMGSTILTYNSFPKNLWDFILEVFPDYPEHHGIKIYAETVCSENDKYSREVGKAVVRKKIEKKYYTIVRKLTRYAKKYYGDKLLGISAVQWSAKERLVKTIDNLSEF